MPSVIHILHNSLGPDAFNKEPESGLAGWHELVAREMAKRTTEFAFECWRPESAIKLTQVWEDEYRITHRIFPSIRFRYGVEISIQLIKSLRREIERRDTVVLHLHGTYNVSTYLLSLLFGGKCPIITQSHDPLEFAWGLRQVQYVLRRFALRKIDRFFVSNESEMDYFSAMFVAGRVRIQPLAVDLELFRPMNKTNARLELGWRTDEPYLLYTGRLVESKGLQYLIKASRMVVDRFPGSHLVIIGTGADRIMGLVKSLGLTDNVILAGQIKHNDLPTYYNAADVFVLPSLREAWGRVIIESLACQTPVIATWTGCVPILTKDGMKGLFVVPMRDHIALADKISQVLPSVTTLRDTIARDQLKQYDWDNSVRQMLNTYKELVGQYY